MKLIIIILISFFLTGCQERIYTEKNVNYFEINDKVQVYNDVKINDILKNNSEYQIVSDNYKIATDKLGEKEYSIYYIKKGKKYIYKFKINVVDETPPLVFSGTNKTVNIGYTGDLCNLITYGDNYSGLVKCSIEGDYDLNKEDTYKLKYYLSDSSNNIKEVNVTLNVNDPSNDLKNDNTPSKKENTLFKEVLTSKKDVNNSLGIDVSKWQGDIDFTKVKEAGASFVMIRIGSQDGVLGDYIIDPYFKENIKNAKNAGLKVGIYFNSVATSAKEAKEQAKWVIKTLNKEKIDLPIAFDWENWSKWNSLKISFHTLNEIGNSFINTINDNGYKGMLYGSKFYLETLWDDYDLVWLANYTEKTSYKGKYLMWQMANNGKIEGIKGDVDIDILYE